MIIERVARRARGIAYIYIAYKVGSAGTEADEVVVDDAGAASDPYLLMVVLGMQLNVV